MAKKVAEDPHWAGLEVILSGPDVPGEGEHKIMSYLRAQKAQPGSARRLTTRLDAIGRRARQSPNLMLRSARRRSRPPLTTTSRRLASRWAHV